MLLRNLQLYSKIKVRVLLNNRTQKFIILVETILRNSLKLIDQRLKALLKVTNRTKSL